VKTIKPKKCDSCKEDFTPFQSFQKVCKKYSCMIAYAKKKEQKKANQKHQKRKSEFFINDRSHQLKITEKWCNKYIRLRDDAKPCISCGRHHKGQYHAGHYMSKGGHPQLRFDENNIHKQCSTCNNHRSGNLVRYRVRLIKKIGLDMVEYLECFQGGDKLHLHEIINIGKKYQQLHKELELKNQTTIIT